MDITLERLIRRLIEEKPTSAYINSRFISCHYNRDERTYFLYINPTEDNIHVTFSILNSNAKAHVMEYDVKDERLKHEIAYKAEDWAKVFTAYELDLLESNIVVDKPEGMEALLEDSKDE